MKLCDPKPCAFVCIVLLIASSTPARIPNNRDVAWQVLTVNLDEKSSEKRALAVHVLRLLPGDSQALKFAREAAMDENPEVRAAAAHALGQLHAKSSVDLLHRLLDDSEPSVVLAAASALIPYKDPAAYEAYYEFLTGERKTNKGLIQERMKTLKDPKKVAELGVEVGIGFIPFAGIGLTAFKTLRVDDDSPVRAAAAKMLTNDPDPESGQALVQKSSDKSWLVRTSALEAIAQRGDPKLLDGIVPAMLDDNTAVRCTAAAAVIRLSTLAATKSTREKNAERKIK